MEDIVLDILEESVRVKQAFIKKNAAELVDVAEKIALAFTSDRKLLLCGNGGSAADAQHIAAEFVNRYRLERPPLPALALTTDTSVITSIGNDYSFDEVFSKQVKALGLEGDVLIAFSTSGNSENVVAAVKDGRSQSIYTVGLLGGDGGALASAVDTALVVESDDTPRVQETHIMAGHILCHLVDHILFQRHLKGR